MKEKISEKQMTKLMNDQSKRTIYCKKCKKPILFQVQTDRVICKNCGFYVYRTDLIEFKYKLKEKLK